MATNRRYLLWGALILAVVAGAFALSLLPGKNGGRYSAIFGRTVQMSRLVGTMRVSLHTAAEAEKSAVLAETDEASTEFANAARASLAQTAQALTEYTALLSGPGPDADLAARFQEAFAQYRKADEEVLELAVQNTNLKAQTLSFEQAGDALARMEKALAPLLEGGQANPKAALPATRALAEALRIQSLHAPHITEKADARMNELEGRMQLADARVRASLAAVAAQGGKDVAGAALAAYEDFHKATGEVVSLSRRNTNVRSLALTLDRKTRALALCDETLRAMEEKIHEDMAKATK